MRGDSALQKFLQIGVVVATASSDVADLGYARYQGYDNPSLDIIQYYGISYAVAPIGDLRWREPVPIETANTQGGVLINATSPGPQCMQTVAEWEFSALAAEGNNASAFLSSLNIGSSEDCLRADVFVPKTPKATRLPVVVQIHGGGYVTGNSRSTDGSDFVASSNGSIVWVQIQYRLGPYGFLASRDVQEDGVANAGLLDQRLALDWVQRHISAFGGDPAKVTIWGGSAGAGSVTFQLILGGGSPSPPFRAAIADYPWWEPLHSQEVLDAQYEDLLSETGCANLSCLRDESSDNLLKASQNTYVTAYERGKYGFGDFYYGPAVDGISIRHLPQIEMASGHFSHVPLIINRDAQEGVVFTNLSISTAADMTSNFLRFWPKSSECLLDSLFAMYPDGDFWPLSNDPFYADYVAQYPNVTTAFFKTAAILGDYSVNCPTYFTASALASHGSPVYKIRFALGTQLHGAIAPFLLFKPSATSDPLLASQLQEYYLSFILNMSPNTLTDVERPYWPPYEKVGNYSCNSTSVLDISSAGFLIRPDQDASPKCEFFGKYSSIFEN